MNLLIDGNNIMFKAYYVPGKPNLVNDVNITPAIRFLNMVYRYSKKFHATSIYIAWDKRMNPDPNSINFRTEKVDDYKGQRPQEDRKDIYKCMDLVIEGCDILGIRNMYPWNLEADDVIAFLCREIKEPKIVASSDSDLLQLVSDTTSVYASHKDVLVTTKSFESFTNIPLKLFLLYKAIKGDTADAIPGISGYGEIKSRRLANDTKAIMDMPLESRQIIKRNIQLMDLRLGVKQSEGEEEYYAKQLETLPDLKSGADLVNWCHKWKIKNLQWNEPFNSQNRLEQILDSL